MVPFTTELDLKSVLGHERCYSKVKWMCSSELASNLVPPLTATLMPREQ